MTRLAGNLRVPDKIQTQGGIELRTRHIIIHQTHYEKSDWSRAFNQFTIACELDMINAVCNICCRYCIYHVKFKVCLVTKPLEVFSSETKWLNASLLFLRMNYLKNV